MARRNPPAKWVLPETVDPERLCIQIEVPNDPAHIAAFRGALLNLANAYRWADDPAHTAKDVALVWKDIIDNMGNWGCGLLEDVRQHTTLPCVLEKKLSGEWQPFANLRYCPPNLRIVAGKLQYYDENTETWVDFPNDTDGTPPGGQPPISAGSDEPIATGECKEVVVTVPGNGMVAIPFRVLPGDTVQIFYLSGGWSFDGSIVSFEWTCGTGKLYAFGACGAVDGDTTGAIVSGEPVGKLIAKYGSHYFDAQDAVYDIPEGWTEDTLFLQMNDPDLTNNTGSVTARVAVCSGSWCKAIDLTASDGGFVERPEYPNTVWVSGTGWRSGVYGSGQALGIIKYLDDCSIYRVEATITNIGCDGVSSGSLGVNAFAQYTSYAMTDQTDTVKQLDPTLYPIEDVRLYSSSNLSHGVATQIVSRFKLYGRGSVPSQLSSWSDC